MSFSVRNLIAKSAGLASGLSDQECLLVMSNGMIVEGISRDIAAAEFMSRYINLIESVAYRTVSADARINLDDILQEVWIRIALNADAILTCEAAGRTVRGWVAACTRNMMRDRYRGRQRTVEGLRPMNIGDAEPTIPDILGGGSEESEEVRKVIATLHPRFAKPLYMVYVEDRTIAAGAAELSMTRNAFKVALHRARNIFKTAWENRN